MSPEILTIYETLRTAYCLKRTVGAEVADTLSRYERSIPEDIGRIANAKSQRMAEMFADSVGRTAEHFARLQSLAATYASFRGELGTLPAFRDKTAKCEPELAAMARTTEDEVFERAVRSLGGG